MTCLLTSRVRLRYYRAEEFLTMIQTKSLRAWGMLMLAVSIGAPSRAQAQGRLPAPSAAISFDQPDAERTRNELSRLLDHYPPALRNVLSLDPGLLENQAYLAPYPALLAYLNAHAEIARNPSFYIGTGFDRRSGSPQEEIWKAVLSGIAVFCGFGMAIGLIAWLIRTLIDYRRWSRLAKVQTDVHTKLLDRFTANEDLLAYIQSPAGSKFLQSSPITLDAGPRSVGAPLGRILWSVQAGLVLIALGIGLSLVSGRAPSDAAQPIQAVGVIGIALGFGFVISAIISFVISQRLGLIEPRAGRPEPPAVQG
jgi:hypothetical protein